MIFSMSQINHYASGYWIECRASGSFVKFSKFCNLTDNHEEGILANMDTLHWGDKTDIISSNFINNNGKIGILIFTQKSELSVINCSIYDNKCNFTFATYQDTLTVIHCYFDNNATSQGSIRPDLISFESNIDNKFTNLFNETIAPCRLRIKQREETIAIDNICFVTSYLVIPSIYQFQTF